MIDVLSVNQSFGYYRTELRGASLQRYFSHENASRGEQKQKGGVTQEQGEENQTLKVEFVILDCTAQLQIITFHQSTVEQASQC